MRREIIGDATIYLGDCLELSVEHDLLLVDPPYGKDFESGKAGGKWGKIANDAASQQGYVVERLAHALKGLKRGRHVYVFGPTDLSTLLLCEPVELIWDKEMIGMGDLSAPWGPQHEPIQFAVYELSKANLAKGYGKLAARLRKGSVLRSLRANSGAVKRHPNEKPVDILRQMIESSSVLGETVYDCMVGSGSTVEAALLEGRKVVACEIEDRYFDTTCERAYQTQRLAKSEGLFA